MGEFNARFLDAENVYTSIKTTDNTISNSTTFVADSELAITLTPGTYMLTACVIYSSSAVADIKFGFSPGSGTVSGRYGGHSGSAPLTTTNGIAVSTLGVFGTRTLTGYATVTATTSISLHFAQNTAEVSNTILYANSWVRVRRIV